MGSAAQSRLESAQRVIARHPLWVGIGGPSFITVLTTLASWSVGSSIAHGVILGGVAYVAGMLLTIYAEIAVVRSSIDTELCTARITIGTLNSEIVYLSERLGSVAKAQGEKLDISIANFNNFLTYVPLYVAAECGFFNEERISANIVSYQDDLAALSSLANRSDYFAISDPMFVFDDSVKDADLKILSPFINKVAVWALSKYNLEDILAGSVRTPSSKDGTLTIRTFRKTTTAYRLAERLKEKMAAKDPSWSQAEIETIVREDGESMEQFFSRNFIDGAENLAGDDILVFSEPEISYLEDRLQRFFRYSLHSLLYADQNFAFTSVLVRKRTLELEPELVRRFLRAIQHAQTFVYSLPRLPLDVVELNEAIKGQAWGSTISAVRTNISNCYPPQIAHGMEDADIAKVIEILRSSSYFSARFSDRQGFEQGLKNACGLSKGATAVKIDQKMVTKDELQSLLRTEVRPIRWS